MIWLLLPIFLLAAPAWEVFNDRNGDFNKKEDVLIRGVICMWMAVFMHLLYGGFTVLWSFALCGAFHFLVFDYWVNYQLIRNRVISPAADWFSYLGESSEQDRIGVWRRVGKWGRLIVRVAVFIGATILVL